MWRYLALKVHLDMMLWLCLHLKLRVSLNMTFYWIWSVYVTGLLLLLRRDRGILIPTVRPWWSIIINTWRSKLKLWMTPMVVRTPNWSMVTRFWISAITVRNIVRVCWFQFWWRVNKHTGVGRPFLFFGIFSLEESLLLEFESDIHPMLLNDSKHSVRSSIISLSVTKSESFASGLLISQNFLGKWIRFLQHLSTNFFSLLIERLRIHAECNSLSLYCNDRMLSSSSALLANVTTGTSFLGGVEIISTSLLFSEKKRNICI